MGQATTNSPSWVTTDIGIAAFLLAHRFSPTIDTHAEAGGLSQFRFEASDELDRLVLTWGRNGLVNGSHYWAALCELKRQIREARQRFHHA